MQTRAAIAGGIAAPGLDRKRDDLPVTSPMLQRWFSWYSQRYLQRHFHSLRVSRAGLPPRTSNAPLVIFSNHASWWDPLMWLALKAEFFSKHRSFSPIDAEALKRYKLLSRLGFFGVEQKSTRGAIQFLRTAERILQQPRQILALTPQGRFADVRERPVRFETGLGHLAARTDGALFVPMASEFVFWEERLPEILVHFGSPIATNEKRDAESWTVLLEQKLEEAQEVLAVESKKRDPDDFQIILHGRAGQGGVYDWYRAAKAKLRGEVFAREHGDK